MNSHLNLLRFNCLVSISYSKKMYVQVNLFQKHLLFHQLTHNLTKDCSLIYEFSNSSQHNMFLACSFHVIISDQSFVILWVSWSKNKLFWQRFTCIIRRGHRGYACSFRIRFWKGLIPLFIIATFFPNVVPPSQKPAICSISNDHKTFLLSWVLAKSS